ncbi:protein DMR6-LIKE OXYGENASE 1-like isoform X2 [Nymphaea colorata]|nr:protein DMR6-LIKE OXYGENASE 1-like isoform X2 [Nymphaea colorata]
MGVELELDSAFLQGEEHRPNRRANGVHQAADDIPVIDLSPHHPFHDSLVERVGRACEEWGFFQVVNHGVPLEVRQKAEASSAGFFRLPPEEKQLVRRDEANPLGYYEAEHTKNVRDWKEVFDFVVREPALLPSSHLDSDHGLQSLSTQWPRQPPGFREACEEYGQEMEKLAFKLLELMSLSLGLPATRLNSYFQEQTSFIRFNHPPCPTPDLALGVGRHKDSGALTILAQDDVGGLQVKRKTDGEWVGVKPVPDSYIINVGDIVQVWSNDKYESVEHRVVVNSERERFSIPFFFHPAHYVIVKPLEEMVNQQNPPKYKEYNWGKFFKTRLLSNFKKLDVENIQVYHFKLG